MTLKLDLLLPIFISICLTSFGQTDTVKSKGEIPVQLSLDQAKIVELLNDFKFIESNPKSVKSLEIISQKIWRQQADEYCDTFIALFNKLDPALKKSQLGILTEANLKNFKDSKVGCLAPDFKMLDLNGKSIQLSSKIKTAKLTLLDFWASWCGPCRQDVATLKALSKKLDKKQLQIIAVSRDDEVEKWQKAINDDSTNYWIHLSTKQNDNSILDKYFVWAIPVKLLIDDRGKIVGRWRGGGEDNLNQIIKLIKDELNK